MKFNLKSASRLIENRQGVDGYTVERLRMRGLPVVTIPLSDEDPDDYINTITILHLPDMLLALETMDKVVIRMKKQPEMPEIIIYDDWLE